MYNKLYSKEVWKYLFFWLLFLVACGGTPEVIPTPVPSPVPTDTPVPAATPVPTKVPEPTATLAATATLGVVPTATQNLPSVAQILADNGRFSTFKTAFEQANLDEALGDPGPLPFLCLQTMPLPSCRRGCLMPFVPILKGIYRIWCWGM